MRHAIIAGAMRRDGCMQAHRSPSHYRAGIDRRQSDCRRRAGLLRPPAPDMVDRGSATPWPGDRDALLTSVTIKRFRSCRDLALPDLGPTVVLVGRNGAGKTNILQAIRRAADVALRPAAFGTLYPQHDVTLEFRLENITYRYSTEFEEGRRGRTHALPVLAESLAVATSSAGWRDLASRQGSLIRLATGVSIQVPHEIPFLGILLAFQNADTEDRGHLIRISRFLGGIHYCQFDEQNESGESSGLISKAAYQGWAASQEGGADPEASVLLKLLHMQLTMPEAFDEVKSILGPQGLGLLEGIRVVPLFSPEDQPDEDERDEALYYAVDFSLDATGGGSRGKRAPRPVHRFAFKELSLGTRRLIKIAVALIYDRSSVMLIEHPEDGIHRGLTRKLFGLLRSYSDRSQMIVSTHSALVLDDLRDDPGAVRLVEMEMGDTKARALTAEEAEHARRYIEEEGTLSKYIQTRFDL